MTEFEKFQANVDRIIDAIGVDEYRHLKNEVVRLTELHGDTPTQQAQRRQAILGDN